MRNLLEGVLRKLDLRFHRAVSAVSGKRISYSQLGEDVWVFQNFLNRPVKDAILVEVGSYNGVDFANTLLFERFAKGRYILIEPAELSSEHCRRNRARALVLRCAISDSYEVVTLLGDSSLSGITKHLSKEYAQEWAIEDAESQAVVSLPLDAVVTMERLAYIDVLSVDVQGAELAVLQGINWSTPIGCIILEVENRDKTKDELCRSILRKQGFEYQVRLGVSEIWTHPRYPRQTDLFDTSRMRNVNSFLFPYLEPGWRSSILQTLEDPANETEHGLVQSD